MRNRYLLHTKSELYIIKKQYLYESSDDLIVDISTDDSMAGKISKLSTLIIFEYLTHNLQT